MIKFNTSIRQLNRDSILFLMKRERINKTILLPVNIYGITSKFGKIIMSLDSQIKTRYEYWKESMINSTEDKSLESVKVDGQILIVPIRNKKYKFFYSSQSNLDCCLILCEDFCSFNYGPFARGLKNFGKLRKENDKINHCRVDLSFSDTSYNKEFLMNILSEDTSTNVLVSGG